MATHSNIFVWETPWTEKPGRLQSMGHKEVATPQGLNNNSVKPEYLGWYLIKQIKQWEGKTEDCLEEVTLF